MDLTAAGYLHSELDAVQKQLGVTLEEIEEVLEILQKLEPTGLFVRDLSECLKLQARERGELTTTMSWF